MSAEGKLSPGELRRFVHEEALPRFRGVLFKKSDKVHFVKAATYVSILEQSDLISTIISVNLGYHSYPILRSQMEGLADLINLNRDENYFKDLYSQYVDSFRRQFIAGNKGNPYFRSLASSPDFSEELSKLGSEAKYLSHVGARRLDPKEKMQKAGMEQEYEALYGTLNDHCHGGIRALMARHVRIEGDDHRLVGFDHGSPEGFDAPLQTSLDVVLRASVEIHQAFGTGKEHYFASRIAELSQ